MGGWGSTFVVAGVATLVVTPLARRLALATGFVDLPAERKSHTRPVPYLGGVAIILGTLSGLLWRGPVVARISVIAIAATVLGLVGLVDDRRTLNPRLRLLLQLLAATAAVIAGLQLDVSGVAAIDVALTIIWIVGVTNAINLLDNMDGLAAGVTLVASVGVGVLATTNGQQLVAALAAGLAGACVGFLAHNAPPAAIFMGDAGSLFLGYLLSVAVLQVDPKLVPPASFAVPLLLLALPVLDTTTVTLARLRHGRPVSAGGKDHLSHRLVARGLSRGVAVIALVGAQALLTLLAVLAGRELVSLEIALVSGTAVLLSVAAVALPAPVYATSAVGLPGRVGRVVVVLAGTFFLLAAPAGVALLEASGSMQRGTSQVTAALDMARRGQPEAASSAFRAATASFTDARRQLHGPLATLGLAVPGVASNLDAARRLVDAGTEVAASGQALATWFRPGRLNVVSGVVPVDELRRLGPETEAAAAALQRATDRLSGLDRPYLVRPVQDAVATLEGRLGPMSREARAAANATRWVPALLGADGPRRYFLAVQNSAELRATGGSISNYGELVADGGKLRLERFGRVGELDRGADAARALIAPEECVRRYGCFRPAETWQNVNMSPDFTTVAEAVADLYPKSGGQRVDGVVAVDPLGLASLLQLTGPVLVPDRAEPLTASNIVDATLRQPYEDLGERQRQRVESLGTASRGVFEALTGANLGEPAALLRVLADASSRRHLMMWSSRPEEQRFLEAFGASRSIPPIEGDSLAVVNQNAAATNVDHYLDRAFEYHLRLAPDGDQASVEGTIGVKMTNRSPALQAGENRSFLTVYTPLNFNQATVNGAPAMLESTSELGRNAYSTFVSIPSQSTTAVRLDVSGRVRLKESGWYVLDLVRQPTATADEVRVRLEVPKGWRIADTRGLRQEHDGRATATWRLEHDQTLQVRLERA